MAYSAQALTGQVNKKDTGSNALTWIRIALLCSICNSYQNMYLLFTYFLYVFKLQLKFIKIYKMDRVLNSKIII